MEFLYNNIGIIIALICVIGAVVYLGYKFMLLPSGEKTQKILALLLIFVTEAEKELGAGTGEFKLSYVYDLFTAKFPIVGKLMPYTTFKVLVDKALVTMKDLIKSNQNVAMIFAKEENII